jgi:hypothetical protein
LDIAREVSFRPPAKNLFLVQAFCLRDRKRIVEDGPWIFRSWTLMLEEYDIASITPSVEPNKV